VIAAAREMGLHVPDDLSVIGYDDIEAADYVGLTTIRQQLFESGRRGAEILLAEIDQRTTGPAIARLTPELVVRVTTAPPKQGRG
jgi:LacI family transcriptional regulator